jgi:hypothetical protein
VFVRNHRVVAKWSVICIFLDHCNSPKTGGAYVDNQFLTDPTKPGAGGPTARGVRSDHLSLIVSGKFRSSPVLSPNPLFHEQKDSNSGKTIPGLYNEGLMVD